MNELPRHIESGLREGLRQALSEAGLLDCSPIRKLRGAREDIRSSWDTPQRWNAIRRYYEIVNPFILSGQRIDPYASGLGDFMTPIERAVWTDIRNHGLPFYPQYPVGRQSEGWSVVRITGREALYGEHLPIELMEAYGMHPDGSRLHSERERDE